jgi:hypothetical protein
MKKILFAILATIGLFTSAFAKDNPVVSDRVLDAFTADYETATDVSWTSQPQFAKASFTHRGQKVDVFYNYAGEMLATTHTVDFGTLPQKAQQKITSKYAAYTVKEALQFHNDSEDCYFVSLTNGTRKVILKVKNNTVTTFKRSGKN